MTSSQPRKQRKAAYSAPQHVARKELACHLEESLLRKYNRRAITVVVGDEVKVLRGDKDFRAKTGKVLEVDVPARRVVVDGITHKKADGTEVAYPLHPSNLLIVKLNLDDKRRRAKLGEGEGEKAAKPAKKAATKAKEPKAETKEA